MARVRQAETVPAPAGGVPAELLDRASPVWFDFDLEAAFRRRQRLPAVAPSMLTFAEPFRGARRRYLQAVDDWADVVGITDPDGRVDHRRLRELLQGAI